MSTPQPRKRCKAGLTSLFSTLTATKSYEKHEELTDASEESTFDKLKGLTFHLIRDAFDI